MAQTYKQILLNERPVGEIVPSKVFRTETKPIPTESDLKDGEVLVKNHYLSLDPAMRGWMTSMILSPMTSIFLVSQC
jgi:NADPH-dependent curcumin reductase CurA